MSRTWRQDSEHHRDRYRDPAPPDLMAIPARPDSPPAEAPPPPPAPRLLNIAAIRRSLASVTASPQQAAGDFYGYLFAASPQLRAMFPPVMNVQNERLFSAIMKIAGLLDSPDLLAGYLSRLGADHRKYGVAPEHYRDVGSALMRTLRRHCRAWDDATEAAWGTAYAIASDSMIAGAQAQSGPATWHGRVLRHRMLARDLAVLDIATDQPLPYEPGQYITVQHGRWPRVWRQFSVASPPARDGDRLELNVRMVPGGWVSTALTRDTREGSEVTVGPAAGAMTEQAAGGRDLLLIAGGVGLAPLRALAESALAAGESAASGRRSISLFHGATSALGLYAMPGLRELERCYPWFSATGVVSGDPGFRGRRGNVADIALECDWAGRHAFLAGPPGMIASAAAGLAAAGMPAGCVHYDREAAR